MGNRERQRQSQRQWGLTHTERGKGRGRGESGAENQVLWCPVLLHTSQRGLAAISPLCAWIWGVKTLVERGRTTLEICEIYYYRRMGWNTLRPDNFSRSKWLSAVLLRLVKIFNNAIKEQQHFLRNNEVQRDHWLPWLPVNSFNLIYAIHYSLIKSQRIPAVVRREIGYMLQTIKQSDRLPQWSDRLPGGKWMGETTG